MKLYERIALGLVLALVFLVLVFQFAREAYIEQNRPHRVETPRTFDPTKVEPEP